MNHTPPVTSAPIRVGIIGLGRAGWNIHASILRKDQRFVITDTVDPEPERRRQAEEELGCRSHASRDELLANGSADLVVVATPNLTHEADALAILKAGKHCVMEKPVAMSYRGAVEVLACVEQTGRRLFAHHQHFFLPEYLFLRGLLDSGRLGDLIEIRYNWSQYSRRADWQTLKKNGGGLWGNYGSHALSTMLPLLEGRVISVAGKSRHIKDAGDADDHAHFLIGMDNGRAGDLFITSCCAVDLPRFTILGSRGSAISQEGGKALVRYYNSTDVPDIEAMDGPAANRKYKTGEVIPWKEEVIDYKNEEIPYGFYENVVEVLAGKAEPAVTPESIREIARVLEWGYTGSDPAA